MAYDIEQLFICFLVICIFFWDNLYNFCLNIMSTFKFFLIKYEFSMCSEYKSLLDKCSPNIFSQSMAGFEVS